MCCFRWSKRDLLLFLAGAEAFHTLVHVLLYFSGLLPIKLIIEWTSQLNLYAIIINALITIGLLWLACKANGSCDANSQNRCC